MTENEKVKKWFETEMSMHIEDSLDALDCQEVMKICVKALEEREQYRAIGTVEELKDLREHFGMMNEMCKDYYTLGTIEEFKALKELKKTITEIVNMQLIAGKNNYKEVYNSFQEIVKVIQDNYDWE